MSSLSEIYIKKETIDKIAQVLNSKSGDEAKGFKMTISINDETNNYGQNVTAFAAQTKEQRDAKTDKFYVGNGKVFWTDGKITIASKNDDPAPAQTWDKVDDSPF